MIPPTCTAERFVFQFNRLLSEKNAAAPYARLLWLSPNRSSSAEKFCR